MSVSRNILLYAALFLTIFFMNTGCHKKDIRDYFTYPVTANINGTKYLAKYGFPAGGPVTRYSIFKDGIFFRLYARPTLHYSESDTIKIRSTSLELQFCSASPIKTGYKYALSVPEEGISINYKSSIATVGLPDVPSTFGNGYIEFTEITENEKYPKEKCMKGTFSFKAPSPLGKNDKIQEWIIKGEFNINVREDDYYKDRTMDEVMQKSRKPNT